MESLQVLTNMLGGGAGCTGGVYGLYCKCHSFHKALQH